MADNKIERYFKIPLTYLPENIMPVKVYPRITGYISHGWRALETQGTGE